MITVTEAGISTYYDEKARALLQQSVSAAEQTARLQIDLAQWYLARAAFYRPMDVVRERNSL